MKNIRYQLAHKFSCCKFSAIKPNGNSSRWGWEPADSVELLKKQRLNKITAKPKRTWGIHQHSGFGVLSEKSDS